MENTVTISLKEYEKIIGERNILIDNIHAIEANKIIIHEETPFGTTYTTIKSKQEIDDGLIDKIKDLEKRLSESEAISKTKCIIMEENENLKRKLNNVNRFIVETKIPFFAKNYVKKLKSIIK